MSWILGEFYRHLKWDFGRWENEWTSERCLQRSMTWIWMKFCQIVEGIRTFRLKKTRQKQSGTSLYPDTLSLYIFCPYNPYFSLHFCLKILRGGFCVITVCRKSCSKIPRIVTGMTRFLKSREDLRQSFLFKLFLFIGKVVFPIPQIEY